MMTLFKIFLVLLLPFASYAETNSQEFKRILKSFEIYPTHWLPHIRLARFYLKQGSLSMALKILQDSSHKFPNNMRIKQEMANLYQQIGSNADAFQIYQDLQKRFPNDPDIHLQYIGLLINMNYIIQAEHELKQFLVKQPHSVKALFFMGTLQYQQKKHQEALKYFLQAARLHETSETWRWLSIIWYRLNQVDSAIKAAEASLRLNPTESTTVELYTEYLYVAKQFDKLGRILAQSQERFHSESWFLLAKGSHAFGTGKSKEAESFFLKAYQLEPTELKVILALSAFYIQQEQLDANIAVLEQGLKHHQNREVYQRLATSYKLLGDFKNARHYYELLINTEQTHAQIFLNAAQLAWITKDFISAEFYFMQGTRKFPKSIPLAIELARFYILEQRPDAARRVFENLKRQHSQNPLVLALFGLFEKSQKQLQASATLFKDAILWDSQLLWLRGEYISVLLELKKEEQAITEFKRLIRDIPKNTWAYHQLHQLYLNQNQIAQAKSLQDQAILFFGQTHILTLELQANFAFSQKNYSHALKLYQTILKKQPTNQSVMRHVAFATFHLGQIAETRKLLQAGLELRDMDPEYWLYWGAIQKQTDWIHHEQQKNLINLLQTTSFQERKNNLETLQFKKTAWSEVFSGLLAQQQEDLQKAKQHYQNANQMLPNQPIILARLGMVADQSNQQLEAIQYYRQASLSNDFWVKRRLAMLLGENNAFDEGIEIFKTLLQKNPQHASILNNIAWLQLTRPDVSNQTRKEALKLATQAVQLVPAPEYLDTLAEAYFQLGDREKALELIDQAKKQSLRQPEQYFYMLRQSYRFLQSNHIQPPSAPTYQRFKEKTS